MTSNNPMEPGAGLPAEPPVPSSEELGLEQRVHNFPNTDLDEAVERGFVDPETPPSSAEQLPEAQAALTPPSPPETDDGPRRFSRRSVLVAGGGVLLGGGLVYGLTRILGGDNSSDKAGATHPKEAATTSPSSTTPASTTPATTAPETVPPTAEKLPLLQLPISDDPLEIGKQLYANHAAWLNTNDPRYGDYTYTNSGNINQVKAAVGNAAQVFQQYRNTHPGGVRIEYDITLLNNSPFSPVNAVRAVTYDVIESQKDESGNTLQTFHYIDALKIIKTPLPTTPGSSQTVDGWLIDGQTEDQI